MMSRKIELALGESTFDTQLRKEKVTVVQISLDQIAPGD